MGAQEGPRTPHDAQSPVMPIPGCSRISWVQASLQCCPTQNGMAAPHALRLGHPITPAEPSADLGPPCTHPACHSTLREQGVPRGVTRGSPHGGGKGCPLYRAGGERWAARLPGVRLPARGTGPGGCHSLVFAAIPPSPAAWPSAGQPAGEMGRTQGDNEPAQGPGHCAHLSRTRAVPRPSPARSRWDTAGSGSSAGRGRSWPGTGHTCSPRSRGGRGRCCSRGTAG